MSQSYWSRFSPLDKDTTVVVSEQVLLQDRRICFCSQQITVQTPAAGKCPSENDWEFAPNFRSPHPKCTQCSGTPISLIPPTSVFPLVQDLGVGRIILQGSMFLSGHCFLVFQSSNCWASCLECSVQSQGVVFCKISLLSFSKKRKADLQENTDERVAKERTEGAIQRRGRSVAAGELWTSGDAMDSWTKESN